MSKSPRQTAPPSPAALQAEVLSNIRAQVLGTGPGRVADLALPEALIGRVAGRVLRSSYRERYRVVIADGGGGTPRPDAAVNVPVARTAESSSGVRILERQISPSELAARRALPEGRPGNRAFMAPSMAAMSEPEWPLNLPGSEAPYEIRRAAEVVARKLATKGLLATAAEAVQALGVARLSGDAAEGEPLLRRVGVPTDLLRFFDPPSGEHGVLPWIVNQISSRTPSGLLNDRLSAVPFRFRPTLAGFKPHSDSGQLSPGLVRLQLTRGGDWLSPTDGGCMDVARQLMAALPNAEFVASIERRHLADAISHVSGWPKQHRERLTLIPEELPVSQWAQDNGKAGWIEGFPGKRVMLAPRYASRGEDGSQFIPGETYLAEGLAAAGIQTVRSPLLFQGGNLLSVREGGSGRHVLLIGEAEIARNVALGLSPAQAEQAFASEFAADQIVVLPAASYHIDYEVSVRATAASAAQAFVIDTLNGAAFVAKSGTEVLRSRGLISGAAADRVQSALSTTGKPTAAEGALDPLWLAIESGGLGFGRFSDRVASHFGSPVSTAVGHFLCFLSALDTLGGLRSEFRRTGADEHLRAVYEAVEVSEQARASIKQQLAGLGWEVRPVSGIADAAMSICPLNGLQTRGGNLQPVVGGVFEPLDHAAARVLAGSAGNITGVLPIRCSESQRRDGALRCSAMVFGGEISD